MSYIQQNFQNGQVLKAEQLNYIEDGIVNLLALHENSYLIKYTIPAESNEFEFTFTRPKGKKERALIYFYDPNRVCGAKTIYSDTSTLGIVIKYNPYEIDGANGKGSLHIHLSCNAKAEDTDFEVLIIDPDADTVESFLVNQIVAEREDTIKELRGNIGSVEEMVLDQLSYVQPSTLPTNPTRAGELRLVNKKDLYISVYSETAGGYTWSRITHAATNLE